MKMKSKMEDLKFGVITLDPNYGEGEQGAFVKLFENEEDSKKEFESQSKFKTCQVFRFNILESSNILDKVLDRNY